MQKDNAKYVITTSSELNSWVRFRDILFTVLVWIAYFYFMRDFFVFCWHVLVWSWIGFPDIGQPDFRIVNTIFSYLETITVMGSAYIGWAIYNLLRFRGKQRRKTPLPVTPDDLSALYGFPSEEIAAWQEYTNVTMFHDDVGYLLEVRNNRKSAARP